MSQESIDLVTRALEAVYRRPKPDFDTINALYHPEHVLASVMSTSLGEEERVGVRGYQDFLGESVMTWEGTLGGVVDVAPNIVLSVATVRAKGASTGLETEQRLWSISKVAGGKIIRTEVFGDPADALEAARERD